LNQTAPEAANNSPQLALRISGCCRQFHQRNYSPVPLVQRRKDPPFRRRQPIPPPTLEHKREVLPIYTGINIHQIRCEDLGTAAPAETSPRSTWRKQAKVLQIALSHPSS
jgi:hypothetical protein